MKRRVYTIDDKKLVQGDENLTNDDEINVSNLVKVRYFKYPKGTFKNDSFLEYLSYFPTIIRSTDKVMSLSPIQFLHDENGELDLSVSDGLCIVTTLKCLNNTENSFMDFETFLVLLMKEDIVNEEFSLLKYECSKEEFYKP